MTNINLGAITLAWALSIGGSNAIAGDCKPETPGYLPWIFSSTCATTLTSPEQGFTTQASFARVRVAGSQETGWLNIKNLTPAVQSVHAAALIQLDSIIKNIGGSPIKWENPVVNIGGTVTASASPDTNIKAKTLKRTAEAWSPAYALYTATPENMITAQNRCAELLSLLPTQIQNKGTTVNITTTGLKCKATVKTLNIDTWAVPLTKLWNELIAKWIVGSDLDDAQITAIMLANGTTPMPTGLSPESQNTIKKLTKELQDMRVIDINGSLTVSVMINKTEYNWTNIWLGITVLLLLCAALYARGRSTGRKEIYA